MNDLTDKVSNPANVNGVPEGLPANYKPMTTASSKLQIADKPGWRRYWFADRPGRLEQAQQAGYRFVDSQEVVVPNQDLGGDATISGNTDMGTRVSVVSGDSATRSDQPERLYLMEIRQDHYEYSQKFLAAENEKVAAALRGGMIGKEQDETGSDTKARYQGNAKTQGKIPDLFIPKTSRRT